MIITKAETEDQKKAAVKDLLDGKTTYVYCGTHDYFPQHLGIEQNSLRPPKPGTPGFKCPSCWNAYYLVSFARLPKNVQMEHLEAIEEAAAHAVEAEKKGTWDFTPTRHPEIEITKDGN